MQGAGRPAHQPLLSLASHWHHVEVMLQPTSKPPSQKQQDHSGRCAFVHLTLALQIMTLTALRAYQAQLATAEARGAWTRARWA